MAMEFTLKTLPVVERLILEKVYFEYITVIPREILDNMCLEMAINFQTKALRAFFRTFAPGREVRREVVRQAIVYDSWWDHFKSVWPRWMKRHVRVGFKVEQVVVKHFHMCPHTGIEFGRDQEHVHWDFLRGLEENDF